MLATLLVAALTALPGGEAPDVLELAGSHDVGMPIRFLAPIASAADDSGLVAVSDLSSAVAGVRVDSGLVVWTRRIEPAGALRGVWVVGSTVIVAGPELVAYRGDVGTRLWSRDLSDGRVVGSDESGLWLAEGGEVQTSLVRLDPESGVPKWARSAGVGHARGIISGAGWVAVAEGQSPWSVRFFDVASGRELGAWTRRVGGVARPVGQLVGGRALYAIDTRPDDGMLAHVIVVAPDGREQTTRLVPRDPAVRNQIVWAAAPGRGSERALALFVPDPAAAGAQLVGMTLAEPFTATTATVPSWAEPFVVAGHVVVPPPPTAAAQAVSNSAPSALWTAWDAGAEAATWTRRIEGLGAGVRTYVAGERLVLVDADGPEAAFATVSAADGSVQAIGTAGLGSDRSSLASATVVGNAVVVARGRMLHRLVQLSAADVRARLKRGADQGLDVGPVLKRLARFGSLTDGLAEAVTRAADPVVSGGTATATAGNAPALALEPADVALLGAYRDAWASDPKGALEGLMDAIDRAEPGSARRAGLLDGGARLVLGEVLATGSLPRDEDARSALVGLGRTFEGVANPGASLPAALWTAVALKLDEPLLAADILARARSANGVEAAYLEAARRASRGIRTSAGALVTDTQREMLVQGLRFFRHLDAILEGDADRAAELMDLASASTAAAKELSQILAAHEGTAATQKSALGPAACALACDAAARLCSTTVDSDACEARCLRQAVVRFTDRARPSASDDRATWFCGP